MAVRSFVESFRLEWVIAVSAKHIVKHSRNNAKDRVPSRGRANLRLLSHRTDAAIRQSAPAELPELPSDFWDEAIPVVSAGKVPISLRVDSDVLEWFREVGPKYQSRMNAVLRSYMERSQERPKGRVTRGPSNTTI